jgi:glycosyltransferase involved in cell wall biosynthesis
MLKAPRALFHALTRTRAPEISVLIPVFNKASYLDACLKSVLEQSLKALEIICIDDCSTDESLAIARRHAADDPRVVVVQTAVNSGPGVARNAGLERARGKYVSFLDADDLLPADALATLHELAVSTGSQLTKGTLGNCSAKRNGIWLSDEPKVGERRSLRLRDEPALWIPYFFVCYLYSRQFLAENRIKFPLLRAGEDPVFLTRCLTKARTISATSAITYIYRRDGSTGQRRVTPQHLKDFVAHAALVKDLYQKSGNAPCWSQGCEQFYLENVRLLMSQVRLDAAQRQSVVSQMRNIWPLALVEPA